jgi:hypothetical protein
MMPTLLLWAQRSTYTNVYMMHCVKQSTVSYLILTVHQRLALMMGIVATSVCRHMLETC